MMMQERRKQKREKPNEKYNDAAELGHNHSFYAKKM
jgi:hypothetical protein